MGKHTIAKGFVRTMADIGEMRRIIGYQNC